MLTSTNKLVLFLISLCILGHLDAHTMLRTTLSQTAKKACMRPVIDYKTKILFKAFLAYERDWTGRSSSEISCGLCLGETFEIPLQTIARYGEISWSLTKKFKLYNIITNQISGEIILCFEYDNLIIKRKLEPDYIGDTFATDPETLGCILYVKKQTPESE